MMIKKKLLQDSGLFPAWQLKTMPASQEVDLTVQDQSLDACASPSSNNVIQETVAMLSDSEEKSIIPQWDALEAQVVDCQRCRLAQQRTKTVFGVGDRNPDFLFVGEGPGAEEDRQGEPFVGQAGKLLDAIFASLGMSRKKGIYIANAVKCRPPENRKPFDDEMQSCFPYLDQQIEWLSPKIIIALGATGAQTMLKTDTKIGALRGKVHYYKKIPLIATYHPAYLLRSPMEKAKVWADMVFAIRTLHQIAQET